MSLAENRTKCDIFESTNYAIVAIVSSSSATISVLATLTVISLIIILKKYIFFVQRLILYLCVAAFLSSTATAFRFQEIADLQSNSEPENGSLHMFCVASAFILQVTSWSAVIAICCITINLLLTTVFKKDTEKLEFVYLGLIFIFPFTFTWIPFLNDTYGDAGAWCWIKVTDEECNPKVFGIYLRYALWYIPGLIVIAGMIFTYTCILIWVTRRKRSWVGKYDSVTEREKENLRKEAWPLMFYPFGFILLNLPALISTIHDTVVKDEPVYALWTLHAITGSLQGAYIAFIFVLAKDTRNSLNCRRIRAALCHKDTTISEYPVSGGIAHESSSDTDALVKNFGPEIELEQKVISSGFSTNYTAILSTHDTK